MLVPRLSGSTDRTVQRSTSDCQEFAIGIQMFSGGAKSIDVARCCQGVRMQDEGMVHPAAGMPRICLAQLTKNLQVPCQEQKKTQTKT